MFDLENNNKLIIKWGIVWPRNKNKLIKWGIVWPWNKNKLIMWGIVWPWNKNKLMKWGVVWPWNKNKIVVYSYIDFLTLKVSKTPQIQSEHDKMIHISDNCTVGGQVRFQLKRAHFQEEWKCNCFLFQTNSNQYYFD